MTIEARNYEKTVKAISFIKGWTKLKTENFLKDQGAITSDDLFLLMDFYTKELTVKIHTYGTPKMIMIEL